MSERSERPSESRALVAAVRARDVAAVRAALATGANPRLYHDGETPLHVAARRGSLAVVETLLAGGALEWQEDRAGRKPLDVARLGKTRERAAIVSLLDRSYIADTSFRNAVAAIHVGDTLRLGRLLDAEPRLLVERIVGPDVYRTRARKDYFLDPKLVWFVANNPTTVARMPDNIVDVTRTLIDRGVGREDLAYALELVMTSSVAREQSHQLPLVQALLAAGALATRSAIVAAAAYREVGAVRALVDAGRALDAPIAATFGDVAELRTLLPHASEDDVAVAFGLAVVNDRAEAARLALAFGANVDAFLPVHAHATALHQAAGDDNVVLIDLLLAAGARTDLRDTLWDATPLEWARFAGHTAAAAALSRPSATIRP